MPDVSISCQKPLQMFRFRKGVILLFTFMMVILISGITIAFLNTVFFEERRVKFSMSEKQAFNVAEAGLHKAVWYLEEVDSNWQGSTTEVLEGEFYTYTVSNIDLTDEPGVTVSVSSETPGQGGGNAIDNAFPSFWRSLPSLPQDITINFPSGVNFSINSVRLRTSTFTNQGRPEDYQWQVSSDGLSWTAAANITGNTLDDRIDSFPSLQTQVNYLRLYVTIVQAGARVRVHEIEVPAIRITSQCSMVRQGKTLTQTITQKGVIDNSISQVYRQPKTWVWNEQWN